MHIDKNLLQLAKDFNFKLSELFIFREVSDTIVIIKNSREGVNFSINLFALSENLRKTLIQKLEAFCKENKCNYKINNKSFEFIIPFGVKFKLEKITTKTQELLAILNTNESITKQSVSDYNGIPVYTTEIPELKEIQIKNTKNLSVRLTQTLTILAGILIVLFFAFQRFPSILDLATTPFMSVFLVYFLTSRFFKGFNSNQSSLTMNLIISCGIAVIATIGYIYTVAYGSIPPTFHKSLELANSIIIDWNQKIAFVHTAVTLCLYAINLASFWNHLRDKKLTLLTVEDCEKTILARNKLGFFAVAFLALGGLVLLYSFSTSFDYDGTDDMNNFWLIHVLSHILLSILFYFLVKKFHKEAKYLVNSEMIMASVAAPILATTGLFFALPNLNIKLSPHTLEKKSGFVSQFRNPKAWKAACFNIIDDKTKMKISIHVCDWEDKFFRTGTKVIYETQKGFFGDTFYLKKQLIHPETVEELLSIQQNNLKEIRSVDVKYLFKKDAEKKTLYEKYLPNWEKFCTKDEGVYCRLASYLTEEKGDHTNAQLLLEKGCQLNDYTSCYGLRLKKPKDPAHEESHETLTLQACKNGDLEACSQFSYLWNDDSKVSHRTAFKEVLEKLCKAGDQYSCNQSIWEKYRI